VRLVLMQFTDQASAAGAKASRPTMRNSLIKKKIGQGAHAKVATVQTDFVPRNVHRD
jgi:hypothetical protein